MATIGSAERRYRKKAATIGVALFLFRHKQVGRTNCKVFFLKFNTRRSECAGPNNNLYTSDEDQRVTRIESFLRKRSLDELPQSRRLLIGARSLLAHRHHALSSHAGRKPIWRIYAPYWQRHVIMSATTELLKLSEFCGATGHVNRLRLKPESDRGFIEDQTLWGDMNVVPQTQVVVTNQKVYE